MVYTCKYKSLIGDILLAADEIGLIGLWFEGQKYFANTLPEDYVPQETKILTEAKKWLDVYFSGEEPKFTPPLHPTSQYSDRKCGRFYYRFPTDRRSPMEKLHAKWQR